MKKYTLNFIALGVDGKTYLRYYCDNKTLNIPLDLQLTKQQLKELNDGSLGGLIQSAAYQIRTKYVQIVETLALKNNKYPTPEQIKEYLSITEKSLELEWLVHKYFEQLETRNKSTRKVYAYAIGRFKDFFLLNHITTPVKALLQRSTIDEYDRWLLNNSKIKSKRVSPISVHNYKHVVKKFLNFCAGYYNLPEIEYTLHIPEQSSKWHITSEDVDRLLKHKPTSIPQQHVLDIIKLNKHIGMRITDILNIHKENISFDNDCAYIRFIEHKRKKERTVVVIDKDAIDVLKHYNGWQLVNYTRFNDVLKAIAKQVFKEETVNIYKINNVDNDYKVVKKSDAISSHAFRRFAIQQNLIHYGIDVARSLSGHTNYQTITRHYAEFINKEDLKKKLLKKL